MKTFEKLCKKFSRINPGFTAELDKIESYRGCYRVYVYDIEYSVGSWYIFKSCREFAEWSSDVVLW